jgi:D-alanyl-D-alanine carboxypeptidase/D-alanyl-D-alanine-endopeptidase (penicillin-binding protein 4)
MRAPAGRHRTIGRACVAPLAGICIALFAALPPAAAADPAQRALTRLQKAIAANLRKAGGTSSALVVDSTTGATLYSAGATTPMLPASLQKLYTTSAVLDLYGPSATLQTDVLGTGSLTPNGTWDGDLYLLGGGDPTFGDATFDAAAYGTGATVQQLAADLRADGVRAVSGSIIGDGSLFDAVRGTPATKLRPNLEIEGELGGLVYDAGFTSPAETALQPRPALAAALAFAAALRADRIRVPAATPIYTATAPATRVLLATADSPSISQLLALTNAPSDNFFAEMLLKDVGATFGAGGTTAAGAAVVAQTVAADYGVSPRFNDGSGLSRFDRTTAAQIVSLLQQQSTDVPFVASLAVAGVSGTMKTEMVGTPAAGNCRGKTGTLDDVANLAGYCTAGNGDQIVFAIFENRIADADAGHLTEDAIGAAIASYDPLTGAG